MSLTLRKVLPLLALLSSLGLTAAGVVPAAAADRYKLDPEHSYIVFRIFYLGVGYSFGSFQAPVGTLAFDDNKPGDSLVEIEVPAANVTTLVDNRDKHIKSADFLNAAKHPVIAFKSRSVKKLGGEKYEITGDLMLLGKKQPLTVTAVRTGSGKDPWGNHRIGYQTIFTVKRSDFGMDFMIGALSDEVQLTVSVQGIRQ